MAKSKADMVKELTHFANNFPRNWSAIRAGILRIIEVDVGPAPKPTIIGTEEPGNTPMGAADKATGTAQDFAKASARVAPRARTVTPDPKTAFEAEPEPAKKEDWL